MERQIVCGQMNTPIKRSSRSERIRDTLIGGSTTHGNRFDAEFTTFAQKSGAKETRGTCQDDLHCQNGDLNSENAGNDLSLSETIGFATGQSKPNEL